MTMKSLASTNLMLTLLFLFLQWHTCIAGLRGVHAHSGIYPRGKHIDPLPFDWILFAISALLMIIAIPWVLCRNKHRGERYEMIV